MSRPTRALTRLASTISEKQPTTRLTLTVGTVSDVAVGAGTDGGDVVTVTVGADDIDAPHLASYSTPAAGHMVLVALVDGSPAVLGRLVGLPNF